MRVLEFRGKVNGEWWYVTPDSENWSQFWKLVDRDTVGQYTSLQGEGGTKKIYEGDIIFNNLSDSDLTDDDCTGIIEWSAARYNVSYLSKNRWESGISNGYTSGFDIIGNIHDNPDMTKPKEPVDENKERDSVGESMVTTVKK